MNRHFEAFTEIEYRQLLKLAKTSWKLIRFAEYKHPGKVCLWRHDVDFSIHRSLKLAQIEAEEGISATYFVHLHNQFYNPLESTITRLIFQIRDLGHDVGLHFEPDFYSGKLNTEQDLVNWLRFEQDILQNILNVEIKAFSFHNPSLGNWLQITQNEIAGMVNTYGQYFQSNYSYCSDSNGYWRFRRLKNVLEAAGDKKLQVLIHPGWWTPTSMSPRQRISRCINGRATRQHQNYDTLLQKAGRENIR